MGLLAIYVGFALGVSFLCSLLEATLIINTNTFGFSESKRPKLGGLWRGFKDDIDKPLAAILSLNTIAHTVGAAGAGAQATKLFGELYFGIISAILTLLILIFSEIIPKTLGARYWKQLAPFCGYISALGALGYVTLSGCFKKLTGLLAPQVDDPSVSRDDFQMLAIMGHQEGSSTDEAKAMSALLKP